MALLGDDRYSQYWEERCPEQYASGRNDARHDLASGVLRIKLASDSLCIHPSVRRFAEALEEMGIRIDGYSDVGGSHPAYTAAYNREVETEVDRRHGQGTMRALKDRAGIDERPRPEDR